MGVTFSNITKGPNGVDSKIRAKGSDYDFKEFARIFNCVEIDWNGAILPDGNANTGGATSAINTSEQLLDLINTMQKEIYVLTAAVIALAQR